MYETSDLGIAAYLMLKELELKSCGIHPSGRYCFEFEDPLGVASELAMEFLKSDFTTFLSTNSLIISSLKMIFHFDFTLSIFIYSIPIYSFFNSLF